MTSNTRRPARRSCATASAAPDFSSSAVQITPAGVPVDGHQHASRRLALTRRLLRFNAELAHHDGGCRPRPRASRHGPPPHGRPSRETPQPARSLRRVRERDRGRRPPADVPRLPRQRQRARAVRARCRCAPQPRPRGDGPWSASPSYRRPPRSPRAARSSASASRKSTPVDAARPAPGGDRRGCGEPECAGAGDDEHRHCRQQTERPGRLGDRAPPTARRPRIATPITAGDEH